MIYINSNWLFQSATHVDEQNTTSFVTEKEEYNRRMLTAYQSGSGQSAKFPKSVKVPSWRTSLRAKILDQFQYRHSIVKHSK